MLKTRMIGGAAILAVTVVCVLGGGYAVFGYVAALSLIGMYELYKANGIEKTLPAAAAYIGVVVFELFMLFHVTNGPLMAIAIGVLLIMAVYVFTFPKYKADQIFCACTGLAYIVVLMSFIYYVRNMSDGLFLVPLVYICAWGNDTFAYFTGRKLGKHKMSPILSPKKSIEGLIGGIAGAALLGLIYGLIFGSKLPSLTLPAISCCIIGAGGALLAVIGDLAASAVKRDTGIKDYGWLIPGHGGVLDRFDSILYTGPAVYILAMFIQALNV